MPPRMNSIPKRLRAAGRYLSRRLAIEWRRMLRLHATPHEIALGCAAGVFAACTPFLGFQMLLAAVLALILRGNIAAALAGTFIGNPLSWPAIWGASYFAGAWILGLDPAAAPSHLALSADAIEMTILTPTSQTFGHAMVRLSPIFEPLFVGGTLIGLIAAAVSYYPTRHAVSAFQNRHAAD